MRNNHSLACRGPPCPPRPWQSSSSPREPALLLALAHQAARPLRSATLTSPRCLMLAAVSAALVSPWLSPRIIQASGQHHLLRGVPSSRWATFLPGTATLRSYFTYMFTPIICFSHQNGSPLKAGFCLSCSLPPPQCLQADTAAVQQVSANRLCEELKAYSPRGSRPPRRL